MKRYLIQVSIGPVQEFIASARKLRDLWFGSYILSELSKCVAREFYQQGGELIFPFIEKEEELAKDSALIVANKVLVKIELKEQPDQMIEQVKNSWHRQIKEIANEAWKKIEGFKHLKVNNSLYQAQISDSGEFYAVWTEWADNEEYKRAKEKLDRLLQSRKYFQVFNGPTWDGAGIPKNSLDGIREAVLGNKQDEIIGLIKKNECLDALACIKRFYPISNGQKRRYFDDLSDIALSSYRKCILKDENQKYLPLVLAFISKFSDQDINVDMLRNANWPIASEMFYLDPKEMRKKKVWEEYKKMKAVFGEPQKYACILMGDGDQIGNTLRHVKDLAGHQGFSRGLGNFTIAIEKILTGYDGSLIYAGGDDVLAYVPLYNAIDCAEKIKEEFVSTMREIDSLISLPGGIPSFSIGLAIIHYAEPLENALNLARYAEQMAKQNGDRDSLAIIQHKRNGTDLAVYGKWQEMENTSGIVARLKYMVELYGKNHLPSTLGFQLREIIKQAGDRLEFYEDNGQLRPKNVAAALVLRQFEQKEQGEILKSILIDQTSIRVLSNELVIAKHISQDQRLSVGELNDAL